MNLVNFLLKLLEGSLSAVENPARTKAIIAKTLKIMAESPAHGGAINALLDKSSVWSSYSDQKLDLFITNSVTPTYLTGLLEYLFIVSKYVCLHFLNRIIV